MSTRKYLIAGNWKMNKTSTEAKELALEVKAEVGDITDVQVCMCPPFTSIESVSAVISESNIALGAQNLYPKESGAYTGEIAPAMLRDLYCTFVILGHSERREYFGETDEFINEKTKVALENNLKPIVCVGETLEQREAGDTMKVVSTQTKGCLKDLTTEQADSIVVAYEPVWAIGTGKTATPEMAQEVHAGIRELLVEQFGEAGNKIRILYGGSMKPGNASELLDQADIDGGLIGGAALKSKDFVELVTIAKSKV
jgi:triosephosphate isomerase